MSEPESFWKQQDEYNRRVAAELSAMKLALVRGGLATPEQLNADATRVLAVVDQELAARRDAIEGDPVALLLKRIFKKDEV